MSGFADAVRSLLPGAWALKDGHALAFGHIAAVDLPECNERRGAGSNSRTTPPATSAMRERILASLREMGVMV
jgi:hypothetical protein